MTEQTRLAASAGSPIPISLLIETRTALHGVAEWLLAGPQHRRSGTIRLRVHEWGFGTRDGATAVHGTDLVVVDGGAERRIPLRGSLREIAATAGIAAEVPTDLYHDHAPITLDSVINVDPAAAAFLEDWFWRGQQGMLGFAASLDPVLWPEHFDLGISRDDVNFGVSPGDASHQAPYAYVGPATPRQGAFWNAPFGALRPAAELPDAAAVSGYYTEGAAQAAAPPPS